MAGGLLLSPAILLPAHSHRTNGRARTRITRAAHVDRRLRAFPPVICFAHSLLVGSRTDRSGRGGGAVSSFSLSPGGLRLLPFDANVPAGLEYLSSSHGYLALTDPTAIPKAIVLINPVTGRRIHLPHIRCVVVEFGDVDPPPAVIPLELFVDDDEEAKLLVSGRRRGVVEAHRELLLVSVRNDGAVYDPSLAVDDHAAVRLVREWTSAVTRCSWDGTARSRSRRRSSRRDVSTASTSSIGRATRTGSSGLRVLDVRESQWASREETIVCPDDGRRGPSSSAGWARRGWFFPSY
ncbi:hypothetical protein HU200_022533 [Digitaria exilis]|uniref:KIB1-4 beta-propeller domain-containing protein n=1 Tax=Digitaria exilis TaxID=1010633 RepID=A0A835CDL9_9POAL|nr:hypothetical protein HU200_022533 [Digitaria exilis]